MNYFLTLYFFTLLVALVSMMVSDQFLGGEEK